nr:hypothetical protein [Tanacetum cinerariifolium]
MNPIATRQASLDTALVLSEKRLKIERCNARIAFSKSEREEIYQVTLEDLKLSPCYPVFVITAEVPQDFITPPSKEELVTFIQELGYSGRCNMLSTIHTDQMHQPWRTFAAIINRFNLHTIRNDSPLDIKDSIAYKTYYDFATRKVPPRKARNYTKVSLPLRKLSLIKEAEPVKKGKRVKRPAKKSTTAPTAGVAIRDTPGVYVSEKKALAKVDRSKGIEILFDVALSEVAQLKEATKRSKKVFHISQASGLGDGTDFKSGALDKLQHKTSGTDERTSTKPGVLDVPTYDSESKNESWGDSKDDNNDDNDDGSKGDDDKADSDDDGNSNADDNERTDSDDDENRSFTLIDYDEEEHDEEFNLHTIRNDSPLDIKDSIAYKTYYDFATRKVPPRKARNYTKVSLPLRKLSLIKEAEPVKKGKRVKRPAKKSTTAPTAGVAIRDTPGVYVSEKKALAKVDRSKGIEILFDVALSEVAQLKEATKRSKKVFHISQASGLGDGTDFKSGALDKLQHKTSGTDERTSTKPGVLDVPTYDSESKNESWGDSKDDNNDDNDDGSKGDDDKADSDDDGNSNADDNERTDSDDDENRSFTLIDYDEEEHDEEYKSNDDTENVFEEEDDDLYKDVDVRSLGAEQDKERKGDEEMTDVDQNVSQEKSYEQVIEDGHVILTSSQKTESSKQSCFVSSDFASKFLFLENVPPVVDEVASMMNFKTHDESRTQAPSLFTVPKMVVPETATAHAAIVAPTISMITPLPQLTTPSPAPITIPTTILTPALLDFSSLFGFDQRVSCLEMKLVLSMKNVFLAKSSSQHKSTYEAAESLTWFESMKILLDKIDRSESYKTALEHKELYEGLVKSYNLDKDLFSSYGKAYSLKTDLEDKDKDEDLSAGSDQRLMKQKTGKDAKPPKGSKSKESKTSSSKGTKSQLKSSSKSVQVEEPVFETTD